VDRSGRLQRHLTWAQFRNGQPRVLDRNLKDKARLDIELASGS
jgi:hypothetical protein